MAEELITHLVVGEAFSDLRVTRLPEVPIALRVPALDGWKPVLDVSLNIKPTAFEWTINSESGNDDMPARI